MFAKRNNPAKVPVILQMEALECGAASLCMIMAYYNKWVPLEKVRADCGVSRDGSNADNISKAAENYGLQVKAKRYSAGLLKKVGEFPCIVWWNYNHFLVLNGFKNNKAVLNDPAMGQISVSIDEFDSSYSGVCLFFKPGDDFTADGKRESTFGFIMERMRGNIAILALIILVTAFSVLAGVIIPVSSYVYSDEILIGNNYELLQVILILFGVLILYQLICRIFGRVITCRAAGKSAVSSNVSFLWHILRMPVGFFSQRYAGDLTARQSENDDVAKTLVSQLAPVAIQIVLLIFYVAVMVNYSINLTLIGIVTAIVNLFIAGWISHKRMEISRVQSRDEGKVTGITISGIDMIETIKASGAENGFFERWAGYQALAVRSKTAFESVNQCLGPLPVFVQQISSAIVLAMGAWLIMEGYMTQGSFLAFQSMLTSFFNPVNELISAGQSIQEMRSSMERIGDVMKYPVEISDSYSEDNSNNGDGSFFRKAERKTENIQKLSGSVELKDVTFGYSPLEEPLIKNFSLTLKPGSRVALVGGSGSGKSTVAKLIAGLYEPWSGSITFDEKLRSQIPREVFTASVSMVDQEVTMFADTIENNIKMWDTTVESYDMILAARDADIHDDILKRSGGYRSVIKENGKDLSGGQRQRIEIARALAGDPSIIIMDEATSALDTKTEFQVTEAIKNRGITCLVVAHRLSAIRDCDEIVVLDRGVVAERGNHEELMKKNGHYSRLVTTM